MVYKKHKYYRVLRTKMMPIKDRRNCVRGYFRFKFFIAEKGPYLLRRIKLEFIDTKRPYCTPQQEYGHYLRKASLIDLAYILMKWGGQSVINKTWIIKEHPELWKKYYGKAK